MCCILINEDAQDSDDAEIIVELDANFVDTW
jgi:hypothetical protein